MLALLAFLPVRRRVGAGRARACVAAGAVPTSVAVLAVGAVISGVAGVVVVGLALGLRHLLRNRERLCEAVTVTTTAGGLILAGAVLSQNPWRSVDGYVGHSVGVQLLALISVAMLAASVVAGQSQPFHGHGTRPSLSIGYVPQLNTARGEIDDRRSGGHAHA